MDFREDVLLEIASKKQDSLIIVVYGANHAWGGRESCGFWYSLRGRTSYKDNIAVWNKENPDKKFSLIEITTDSYS